MADMSKSAKLAAEVAAAAKAVDAVRIAKLAVLTKLLTAKSIPEFLTIADSAKVIQASAGGVKVLAGSADEGRRVFEAQTAGWKVIPDAFASDGSRIFNRRSLDDVYSVSYRSKSTSTAQPPFTKINATIDVQEFTVFSNGWKEPIGTLKEIKFAE
jgi:hypothetical protein